MSKHETKHETCFAMVSAKRFFFRFIASHPIGHAKKYMVAVSTQKGAV